MTRGRIDNNHQGIKEAFVKMGFSVLDISELKNCCDLFVGKHGETIAIEIKDGAKPPSARKLTKGEQSFALRWCGWWELVKEVEDIQEIDRKVDAMCLRKNRR
jgi:hypothetical protein